MMSNTLTKMRLFTVADFKEEEQWLQEMHRAGWKLMSMTNPCWFHFERCEPEDVVYQLDFRNKREGDGAQYRQIFRDCGWEYVNSCMSFHYFRKSVAQMDGKEEIFSDNTSRAELLGRIWKWRMIPLFVVCFGCIVPQIHKSLSGEFSLDAVFVFACVLMLVYLWVMLHVGVKFFRMKRALNRGR